MAMNLTAAQTAIEDAIKTAMQAEYPTTENGPTEPADFEGMAKGIAPGIIAALQHVLDNAETTSDSGGDPHAHAGIL